MTTVRAKFTVQWNQINSETQRADVVLSPVTATTPENQTFWKATPAGQITLQIDNPSAASQFKVGSDYYVDFIPTKEVDEDTAIWNQ